ncbi:MAG: hypothetical protein QXJ28_00425, partial [Candidatus Pacearchaeota archaeon]
MLLRGRVLLLFTVLILLIVSISAIVLLGEGGNQIKEIYNYNDKIRGEINISLEDESYDSFLYDNFGNRIKIIDLLNLSLVNYFCVPSDCKEDYSIVSEGSKTKYIDINKEAYIGGKITGRDIGVKKLSIYLSGNYPSSCNLQLGIDFNDDGENDWTNNNYLNENCGGLITSSCYSGIFDEYISINQAGYCEKMNLSISPAFEIIADIKKFNDASPQFYSGLLKVVIYNKRREYVGECSLSDPSNLNSGSRCIVNYASPRNEEHYICIKSEEGDIIGYKIKSKSYGELCGFGGRPQANKQFERSYNITAYAKKFAPIMGNIVINEERVNSQNGKSLAVLINTYLTRRYSKKCEKSCVIPIIIKGEKQRIDI